jgi:hypothetical protein
MAKLRLHRGCLLMRADHCVANSLLMADTDTCWVMEKITLQIQTSVLVGLPWHLLVTFISRGKLHMSDDNIITAVS